MVTCSVHQIYNIQQDNYRGKKASPPCKPPSFEALSGLIASAIQTLVSPRANAEPLFSPSYIHLLKKTVLSLVCCTNPCHATS